MPKRPASYKPRKIPSQERAQATYQAILDAAAQFLTSRPDADFDTNAVAERAGVSIGSLYQYFPNKGAVLSALIERQAERKLTRLRELLSTDTPVELEQRIEQIMSVFVAHTSADFALERALAVHFMRVGDVSAMGKIEAPAIAALTPLCGHDSLRAFILLHAVRAVLLGGAVARPQSLDDGSLRAELVTLVRGYLRECGALG